MIRKRENLIKTPELFLIYVSHRSIFQIPEHLIYQIFSWFSISRKIYFPLNDSLWYIFFLVLHLTPNKKVLLMKKPHSFQIKLTAKKCIKEIKLVSEKRIEKRSLLWLNENGFSLIEYHEKNSIEVKVNK